ncbi:hypothetical protein GGR20_003466 [Devosia subaequoris]|uniref:DUF6894 domain-containing protein n=1 Tax=Devosia subaequoris TaxID=395930 RepID=A0A7W6NCM1_9HYPH|nr:hypothetical protein [Devosia subaequoris]MBB4053799.1 hypothetical protein [Devosia subaequoris]MCP1211182.1 hypothetical protein [Devosia subaequoris]
MRYFFNVVRGGQRLQDFEGGEFTSDLDAQAEAHLVARELIGRELIAGKPVLWDSTIEILRADNAVVGVLSFRQALNLPQDV